ncbi:MAG: TetR/AcrR family transcriptional regulator [Pseudomonadota bacterium]
MSEPSRPAETAGETEPTVEAAGPPDTRAAILEHAHALFHHYGFNKTNMADIAERAGMSPANLYRYFRNKQAIGLAVVTGHFEAEKRAILDAMDQADGKRPETVIRALVHAAVDHIVEAMEASPKMIELAEFVSDNPDGLAVLQDYVLWRRREIMEQIAWGNVLGHFDVADPERTAIALQHAIKAFHMPFALARWRDRSTVKPELEAVLDLCFDGIRKGR